MSRLLERDYGIDWVDAGGGAEPLAGAMASRLTPVEFVAWWAEKYALTRRDDALALR